MLRHAGMLGYAGALGGVAMLGSAVFGPGLSPGYAVTAAVLTGLPFVLRDLEPPRLTPREDVLREATIAATVQRWLADPDSETADLETALDAALSPKQPVWMTAGGPEARMRAELERKYGSVELSPVYCIGQDEPVEYIITRTKED
jgi:hypothetical protein